MSLQQIEADIAQKYAEIEALLEQKAELQAQADVDQLIIDIDAAIVEYNQIKADYGNQTNTGIESLELLQTWQTANF